MRRIFSIATPVVLLLAVLMLAVSSDAQSGAADKLPVSVFIFDRTRADAWQWFAAPPQSNSYGYFESLLRLGVAQRVGHWDWRLELSQPAVLGLPDDAVSPVSAQGQLGLGGTYYASNGNNTEPAAAFFSNKVSCAITSAARTEICAWAALSSSKVGRCSQTTKRLSGCKQHESRNGW